MFEVASVSYPASFAPIDSGRKAAKRLGAQRAACVQVFPNESKYLWKEEMSEEHEVLQIIKSGNVLFGKTCGMFELD